jgi:hypothetical protein
MARIERWEMEGRRASLPEEGRLIALIQDVPFRAPGLALHSVVWILPYFFRRFKWIGAFSCLRNFCSHQFWYRSTLNMKRRVKMTIHCGM